MALSAEHVVPLPVPLLRGSGGRFRAVLEAVARAQPGLEGRDSEGNRPRSRTHREHHNFRQQSGPRFPSGAGLADLTASTRSRSGALHHRAGLRATTGAAPTTSPATIPPIPTSPYLQQPTDALSAAIRLAVTSGMPCAARGRGAKTPRAAPPATPARMQTVG